MPEAEPARLPEKVGSFYLGREIEAAAADPSSVPVLYDAKDLTTHAVIVGMTGSGKTGLAVGMLEEAAIDGIPAIVIDVKGDLTNLLLTFPELAPEDFEPWMDPADASRKGQTIAEAAAKTASLWKNGIAAWGQDASRIQRLRDGVETRLLTPGASRGVPMSLLSSLGAPGGDDADPDARRTRILGSVSGLLTLLGIDADPIQSREHIFLSNILSWAWNEGRELSLPDLIRAVQKPPFESVGVIDLESFFPARERTSLALALNNLLASPSFQSWREGEPLSIESLLSTPDGKPRHSVLYLAHLSEAERMFFVTRLLNDVVAWMRTQSGTGSLRALIYMDEVFGYLPPTANPPSKQPLLTLLKQARAYGVGVVLSTQNPVDLDYKALSNAGTWMLGRLQTERDKMRVLDGLEGAAPGGAFDRARVDEVLSGLGKRRFLLHNVHESGPVLFHTRWVLSYLAGPLTLDKAAELARSTRPETTEAAAGAAADKSGTAGPNVGRPSGARAKADPGAPTDQTGQRPILQAGIEEVFLEPPVGSEVSRYVPRLMLRARLHHVRASWNVDEWSDVTVMADPEGRDPWENADELADLRLDPTPAHDAGFYPVPAAALRPASYKSWARAARDYLYRTGTVQLFRSGQLKISSMPGESEGAFRTRLRQAAREERDVQVEKLRDRYETKLKRVRARIQTAEERVAREEAQYEEQRMASILDMGTTVLGSFLGRKRVSRTTISGVSRAAKRFGRASKEKSDIAIAEEKVADLQTDLATLERELEDDLDALRDSLDPDFIELERLELAPRKSDISVEQLALAWVPA